MEPSSIHLYLRRHVARRRRGALVRAGGWAVVFALLWTISACLVDRLVPLPAGIRLAALVIEILAPLLVLTRPVYDVLWAPIDWLAAAGSVESHDAVWRERLLTVVAQGSAPHDQRGSASLLAQLTDEVLAEVTRAQARRSARPPASLPWGIAAALAAVMGALMLMPPLGMSALLGRLGHPWATLSPVTTTRLIVEPGDTDVLEGGKVRVKVYARRLPDGAVDLYASPDGATWTQNAMLPAGPATRPVAPSTGASRQGGSDQEEFTFTLSAIEHDIQYYVTGGDATSRVYRISVLRRPAVSEYRLRLDYPAYIGRPEQNLSTSDPTVEAPWNTQITLDIVASEPLRAAMLIAGAQKIALAPTAEAHVWRALLKADRDQTFDVELTSARGLTARVVGPVNIRSIPDRPPAVRLLQPTEDLRLQSHDQLTIEYQAMDDYGLAALWVVAQVNSRPPRELPVRLRGDPRRQEGQFVLDMMALDVRVDDVVTVWMAAQDRIDRPDRQEHKTVSESRHVVIAPFSTDPASRQRMEELAAAARLADTLAGAIDQAAAGFERMRLGNAVAEPQRSANRLALSQSLSAASEAATSLHHALLRAISHSSGAQADALAAWLDEVRGRIAAIDALSPATNADPGARSMGDMRGTARLMAGELKTLADAEQAACVLPDVRNLRLLGHTGEKPLDRYTEAMKSAQRQVDAAATALGLRGQGDMETALKQKIEAASQLVRAAQPVDFEPPARLWAQSLANSAGSAALVPERLATAAAAEALRLDGDGVRARDLLLASRAAAALARPPADNAAGRQRAAALLEYPVALAQLQHEHELRRAGTAAPAPQATAILAAASAARSQMRLWAGQVDVKGNELAPAWTSEDLALEASAEMLAGHYERAGTLQAQLAQKLRRPTTQRSAPDRPEISRAMDLLREVEEIASAQDALTAQAASTRPASGLPTRQLQLATRLASMDEVLRKGAEDGFWASIQARQAPLEAVAQLQRDLARLGQQVAAAQQAAEAARKATQRLDQAQRDMAAARGDRQPIASRALTQARAEAKQAEDKLAAAVGAVSAARADDLRKQIAAIGSDAHDAAVAAARLRPAMTALAQTLRGPDSPAASRAADQVLAVVPLLQEKLKEAEARIAERDPLAAGQWHLFAAAQALSHDPPDTAAVAQHQEAAGAALARIRELLAQDARFALTGPIPAFAPVYGASADPRAALARLSGRPAGTRRWGRLGRRDGASLDAPSVEAEPPAYQDALRAYFEAIGRARAEPR